MTSPVISLTEADQRTLGAMLWQYRAVLERVEFLLEAQLVFASSGRDKRLAAVSDLLEEAAETVSELDLRRELLLHGSSSVEGRVPSLSDLASVAEQPWSSMFLEHQRWFETCVGRIKALVDQSRRTMGTTLDLINQLVNEESGGSIGGYDRAGRGVRSSSPAVLFDSRA